MILQIYMQRSCTVLDLSIGVAFSLNNYTVNTDNDDHLPVSIISLTFTAELHCTK